MTPEELREISKMLKWAGSSTSALHFAFGVSDCEGVLVLNRRTKGRSLMHDLVQADGNRDLRSERFGTVVVGTSTINLMPNKPFDALGLRCFKEMLKNTKFKDYEVEIGERGAEGEV